MSDTTIPQMPKAPECDRMLEVADDSHKIGEFLDWLQQQGIHLASYEEVDEYDDAQLQGIHHELDRGNDIECIRLDYEGVDSLGPRDYEACG